MSLSLILRLGGSGLTFVGIFILNWHSFRRIRHVTDAESLHLAERFRVLSRYAKLRDGRLYDPLRYPESTYSSEQLLHRRR